jgi:signal transduction histidine kinase/CheY-like chemotaxis protein
MVAMLAYEFDLPIGVNAPLTLLSAFLAVSFTFAAIAGDLLYDRYNSGRHKNRRRRIERSKGVRIAQEHLTRLDQSSSSAPLLGDVHGANNDLEDAEESPVESPAPQPGLEAYVQSSEDMMAFARSSHASSVSSASRAVDSRYSGRTQTTAVEDDELPSAPQSSRQTSSDYSDFRRSSAADSSSGSFGLRTAMGFIHRSDTTLTRNAFIATFKLLKDGFSVGNIIKGFIWSLAITSMHYVGISALDIPDGFYKFNWGLVALSAFNSWVTCTVGFILMAKMETHLQQQILFSMIATTGVAAMHFTGMAATSFWSTTPASEIRGFPPALGGTVVAVAFLTCVIANVLLSHSATVSRNKLAEIVWTRKELFKNIALKEHAEAAARLRSEFIASASHEIRTPLHHLQGYSDLLAQTDLTDEGRMLMTAIQRATKTLALLTNNVLDWSKFEGNSQGDYRQSAVDIRSVCESIVILLPNVDDDADVDTYVVVAPDVPRTIRLDESWIHRIIMNLLSNALKFTKHGYILLRLYKQDNDLVIVVEDTGCGMDSNFIPDMWTPFRQGEVRGSARGTGLGLSIVRQLLHRMDGSIEVESQHQDAKGVGPERSGTKFTVTIPLEPASSKPASIIDVESQQQIAILSENTRSAQGLQSAWTTFGFDVSVVNNVTDLGNTSWTYVWAELGFLKQDESALPELLQRQDLLILIPYDTQDNLDSLPALLKANNIVLIHKPLIWHRFSHRIRVARDRRLSAAPSQALRFAPVVEVLTPNSSSNQSYFHPSSSSSKKEYTVLLVEDNIINRKLGAKMLAALSYKTIFAEDGEEALHMLRAHDIEVDCVLMDQSMPKMDGVTATRMIRRMEEEDRLSKKGRPIIAVTAVVNSQAKEEFREAGANDFLAKPLSLERLRDVLGVYLPVE